jgi:uracil-DNA glycosylase
MENVIIPTPKELRDLLLPQLKVGGWYDHVRLYINSSAFLKVLEVLINEIQDGYRVTPMFKHLFSAFANCPYDQTKVVIHTHMLPEYALHCDGMAFSRSLTKRPDTTLKYIFDELKRDNPKHKGVCNLKPWAEQGVLLLSSAFTTNIGIKNAHLELWKPLQNELFDIFKHNMQEVVFVFVGKEVWHRADNLHSGSTVILFGEPTANFPKPWNSNAFKVINETLTVKGKEIIKW